MTVELKSFFQRCYCVNLARRKDRWQHMQDNVIPHWPLAPIVRWEAIDGKNVPPPGWWRAGAPAWAIYRNHSEILEKCINEGVKSVLILEDDAILREGFTEKVADFLEAVPKDWGMIYLGGQHLDFYKHPPRKINDLVYRPHNVNRCQAMALQMPSMRWVYQWIHRQDWMSNTDDKGVVHQHHIDHHLGRLHESRRIPVYVPNRWLIGQGEGQSDICGAKLMDRWWPNADGTGNQQVVAVVGTYRGGSSCVAGVLHKLGAPMGQKFFQGKKDDSPEGCFEAQALYDLCMRAYPEPRFVAANTYEQRVNALRTWLAGRWNHGTILGAKHPKFCLMVPEILEAWPTAKLVVVDRNVEESVASLLKAKWWGAGNPTTGRQWSEAFFKMLLDKRNRDLEKVDPAKILRIQYPIKDREAVVDQLIAFSGLSPTPEQRAAGIAHIKDSAYRNRAPEAAANV